VVLSVDPVFGVGGADVPSANGVQDAWVLSGWRQPGGNGAPQADVVAPKFGETFPKAVSGQRAADERRRQQTLSPSGP